MIAFYLSLIESENEKRQFEEIYNAYKKPMFFVAHNVLKSKEDAEDVVHNVFCSVASSHMDIITNAEKEEDIRNYLLKSVKNASISLIRKRKTRSEYEEKNQKEKNAYSDGEFLDKLCNRMDAEKLMSIMEEMDEKYREVLYYRYVLDLSLPEMSEVLGRLVNTIKKQLSRAKCIIAALFSGEEVKVCR